MQVNPKLDVEAKEVAAKEELPAEKEEAAKEAQPDEETDEEAGAEDKTGTAGQTAEGDDKSKRPKKKHNIKPGKKARNSHFPSQDVNVEAKLKKHQEREEIERKFFEFPSLQKGTREELAQSCRELETHLRVALRRVGRISSWLPSFPLILVLNSSSFQRRTN